MAHLGLSCGESNKLFGLAMLNKFQQQITFFVSLKAVSKWLFFIVGWNNQITENTLHHYCSIATVDNIIKKCDKSRKYYKSSYQIKIMILYGLKPKHCLSSQKTLTYTISSLFFLVANQITRLVAVSPSTLTWSSLSNSYRSGPNLLAKLVWHYKNKNVWYKRMYHIYIYIHISYIEMGLHQLISRGPHCA